MLDHVNKIDHNKLEIGRILGEGGFGTIYMGVYSSEHVAIKTLKSTNITGERASSMPSSSLPLSLMSSEPSSRSVRRREVQGRDYLHGAAAPQ